MKRDIFVEMKSGKILLSDGAWGTILQNNGLTTQESPESFNLTHPEVVAGISKDYFEAGSDLSETNTFGASPSKLAHYGLEGQTWELNQVGAELAKSQAHTNAVIIGSMGPSGKMLCMEEIEEETLYEDYKQQALALKQGGVDLICFETMMDPEEAMIGIDAVVENTNLPVACTFTFEKTVKGEYRTIFGATPSQVVELAIEHHANIVGTNCGNGMAQMADIVREMRTVSKEIPILVHANAGLPVVVDGAVKYLDTPEKMAEEAVSVLEAGANIIGGCCGTTPSHIAKLRVLVDEWNAKNDG